MHKVDRLARNRADDVEINLAIQQAGAALVSGTENIDETPSGMLLHGIMSSIAEFYSQNLANEVIKGTCRRSRPAARRHWRRSATSTSADRSTAARSGPSKSIPSGPTLIRWAFEAYATGEWTMSRLRRRAATAQGITVMPTTEASRLGPLADLPDRAHPEATATTSARSADEDVWYAGRHEPMVSPATVGNRCRRCWRRQQSGEKPREHPHYLKGSLCCGQCGELLGVEIVRNHQGRSYPYFYCLGRQKQRNGCQLRATPIELVEQKIVEHWQTITLSAEDLAAVRANVMTYWRRCSPSAP